LEYPPVEELEKNPYQGFGAHHKNVNWTAIMKLGRDEEHIVNQRMKNKKPENENEVNPHYQNKKEYSEKHHHDYFCGPPSKCINNPPQKHKCEKKAKFLSKNVGL
jgi:hypothetical protein